MTYERRCGIPDRRRRYRLPKPVRDLHEAMINRIPGPLMEQPFQVLVCVVSILLASALLILPALTTGSADALPRAGTPVTILWKGIMLLGAPLTLVGMFWHSAKNISTQMAVERAGLYLMSSAWGTRAVTILWHGDAPGSFVAGSIYLAIALACLIRAIALARTIQVAQRAIRRNGG